MAVDSDLGFRIHSQKLGPSFQERLENRFRIMEIVVNNVDQERSIHDLGDELA